MRDMEKGRIQAFKWWQFHHTLWRYKYVVASIVIVGTFVAVVYTARTPKQYRATASAMLDSFSNVNLQDYSGSASADLSHAHKQLAESNPVWRKACDASQKPKSDKEGNPLLILTPDQCDNASGSVRADGVLIYFDVIDGDYGVARRLAFDWRDAFIAEIAERQTKGAEERLKSLTEEYNRYKEELDKETKKKEEIFNNKFDPERYKADPIHAIVAAYQTEMRQLTEKKLTLDEELKALRDPQRAPPTLVLLQHVAGDATFMDRLHEYNKTETEVKEVKAKFREGPEWVAVDAKLAGAKQLLEESRANLIVALEHESQILDKEFALAEENYKKSSAELD